MARQSRNPWSFRGGYEEARGSFEGYLAGLAATATKVGTVLPEVPQTINVIGREEISSRTSTRLSETLRYTPGVTVEADGADSRFDSISIRGFNTDNATWLDGMAALATAVVGPIAFVALIAPQQARLLMSGSGVSPAAAGLAGAALLSSADLAAQHLFGETQVPVGTVMLCLGGVWLIRCMMDCGVYREGRNS